MTTPAPSRYEIVPRQPRMPAWLLALAMLLIGMAAGAAAHWWWQAPAEGDPRALVGDQARRLEEQASELEELRQRVATLSRSDQISRDANKDVQDLLAQREEEIAGLRADVAFYERFVGSSGPRRGLAVHSVEFAREAGGSWRYQAVLTQSINRGGMTRGQMRFDIEGVRNGRLSTVKWDEMHQTPGAPAQDYGFRYFQRLGGSVILPAGFTPQRVRVSLRGAGGNVEQAFPWTAMDSPGGN